MTKYSTELKIEIVSKYLNHEDSIKGLAKQYNIHWTLIRRWIDKAKCGTLLFNTFYWSFKGSG